METSRIVRWGKRVVMAAGLAVATSGCGWWVAITPQLNEMEERLRADFKKQIDATNGRVGTLEGKVSALETEVPQVRALATDARQRADRAQARADEGVAKAEQGIAKANEVDGRVTRSLANRYKRAQVQQFNVAFDSGKSILSDEAKQALRNVAKMLADNPTYTADSIGHTDDVGSARYNVNLSWRREEAIRRFLIENGADLNRVFFIGLGEEKAAGKDAPGRAKDRRGTTVVYRPAD